ncbi:hypothetical protein V8J88_10600 [Massilia sp. W12]|uniref:hypothetical protein n=1 Tax=Massilia sp. W12 TaxID=3126507 RepID=UPI0030CF03AD
MKAKLSLFLFAIGLAASSAYAYDECRYGCDLEYRQCLAQANGDWLAVDACIENVLSCKDRCRT